jgi:hypothetical protein
LVVSSIGSIPVPIPGIPQRGEVYDYTDRELGRIAGYDTVFGAGNAVTGKGNIMASRKHGVTVATHVIEEFLGLRDGHAGEEAALDGITRPVDDAVKKNFPPGSVVGRFCRSRRSKASTVKSAPDKTRSGTRAILSGWSTAPAGWREEPPTAYR